MLCIESNETREQALLLIESLRTFGGRLAGSPILAVAPRAGLGIDARARARLDWLEVTYHEGPLNTVCPEYGSANRVFAAAWAADTCRAETLFVLDSDTLFLGEPEPLGPGCDLAVRPVDVKGSTTCGPGDPFDSYWTALGELAGIPIESLPWVETVLDHRRVRASYNGGYSVVRRSSGILQRAAEIFTRSVRADLRPYSEHAGHRVFASTGDVPSRAAEYWGSNQAAFSLAAWSTTRRVRLLDRRFNVPLHGLADPALWSDDWLDLRPLHIHYHWMLRAGQREQALRTMTRLGVPADRLEWIRSKAPIGGRRRIPVPGRSGARGRPLVICGMHRSATSLVASALQQAGLDIGRDLMGPARGNRRGHFEDRPFWRLHEDMLAAAGCTALTADDDFAPPAGGDFERRARALIEQRSGLEMWGWKDPRTCLLLDFWNALLPEACYLMLYRHPIEVALSLRRRATEPEVLDDPWTGIRAWELYNRRLLAFFERHAERCFLAQVPALTADLPAFVRRVATELDLPLRELGTSSPFLPAELTTSLEDAGENLDGEELIPEALALYRRLEELADLASWQAGGGASRAERAAPETSHAEGGRAARMAVATLFQDLRESRPAGDGGGSESTAGEDSRPLRMALASLAESRRTAVQLRRRLAEAERLYRDAADRRDELSATLTEIERSRSFALVARWWRIAGRLRRSKR